MSLYLGRRTKQVCLKKRTFIIANAAFGLIAVIFILNVGEAEAQTRGPDISRLSDIDGRVVPPNALPTADLSAAGGELGNLLYPQRFSSQQGSHRNAAAQEPAPPRPGCAEEAEQILERLSNESPLLSTAMNTVLAANVVSGALATIAVVGSQLYNIAPDMHTTAGLIGSIGVAATSIAGIFEANRMRNSASTPHPSASAFFNQLAQRASPDHAAIYRAAADNPTTQNINEALRTLRARIAEQRRALAATAQQPNQSRETSGFFRRFANLFRGSQTPGQGQGQGQTQTQAQAQAQRQAPQSESTGVRVDASEPNCPPKAREAVAEAFEEQAAHPERLQQKMRLMVRMLEGLEYSISQSLVTNRIAELSHQTPLSGDVCLGPNAPLLNSNSNSQALAALAQVTSPIAPCTTEQLRESLYLLYDLDTPSLLPRSVLETHAQVAARAEAALAWLRGVQQTYQQIGRITVGAAAVYELVTVAGPAALGATGLRTLGAVSPGTVSAATSELEFLLTGEAATLRLASRRGIAAVGSLATLMPLFSTQDANAGTLPEALRGLARTPPEERTVIVPRLSLSRRMTLGSRCYTSLAIYTRTLRGLTQ